MAQRTIDLIDVSMHDVQQVVSDGDASRSLPAWLFREHLIVGVHRDGTTFLA